ncbi:MAG: sensor histidine kinase [Anaerolineae bacterium]|nr:sensor histidine kinase [Anaerolineae bacterium]
MKGYLRQKIETYFGGMQELMLVASGLLAWASVTTVELIARYGRPIFWPTVVLLGAFGILTFLLPRLPHGSRGAVLFLSVQTLLVLIAMLLDPHWGTLLILYFVLSVEAVQLLATRGGLLWIGGLALLTITLFVITEGLPTGLLYGMVYGGGYYFFGAFGLALVRAETAHRRSEALLAELRTAHRQLQEYAVQVEELAVAEERNRLAREMHDTLGHALTMAVVQLEAAQRLLVSDPARSDRIIGTVREELRGALTDLRRTVAALRMPFEAELPLHQSLARLAQRFQEACQLPVHLALAAEPSGLTVEHRLAFYRMAQEALTNIQKHARAQQVWSTFTAADGYATLVVSDDGVGLGKAGDQVGFGLHDIRERVVLLGGELHLDERPGGGAQLHCRLPLPEAADAAACETPSPADRTPAAQAVHG